MKRFAFAACLIAVFTMISADAFARRGHRRGRRHHSVRTHRAARGPAYRHAPRRHYRRARYHRSRAHWRGHVRYRHYSPRYYGPRYVPGPRVIVGPRILLPPPVVVYAPPVVVPAPRVVVRTPVPAPVEVHEHDHYYHEGQPAPHDNGYAPEGAVPQDLELEDEWDEEELEGEWEDGDWEEGDPGDPLAPPAAPVPGTGYDRTQPPTSGQWDAPAAPVPAAQAADPEGPNVLTSDELYRIELDILRLIGEERARAGLEPLMPHGHLSSAALQHSGEMYSLNYFDHTSPVEGNTKFTDRMGKAGVEQYGTAAENIVMAPHSKDVAARFVKMWMESPGHRENILRPEFRFTGIGVFGDADRVYATQLFSAQVGLAEGASEDTL